MRARVVLGLLWFCLALMIVSYPAAAAPPLEAYGQLPGMSDGSNIAVG